MMIWPYLTQSFWRDEAFSVILSSRPFKDIFGLVTQIDHTPPLFYFFQHFWIAIFGDGEIAVRLLSLIFYLPAVYFVYRLTKSRLAALSVGFNPFLWQYALEARHYSIYLALVLGAIYFSSHKKIVWANIFWAMALWTHNFSWIYFLLWLILTRDKRLFPAAAAGAVWLPFAFKQITGVGREMWLKIPAGLWWWRESLKTFLGVEWLGIAAVILAIIRPNLWAALAFLPLIITYLVSILWTPVYLERYLLPAAGLIIIYIARLKHFRPVLLVYLLMILSAFFGLNRQATKPNMFLAAETIGGKITPEEIIITQQPINYLEMYFYLSKKGLGDRLYSYLYPGEDHIPSYVGVEVVKPQTEILTIPLNRPFWLVKPDGDVVRYEASAGVAQW